MFITNRHITLIDKDNTMYVGELVADESPSHLVIKNPVAIAYPKDKDGNVSIALVPVIYADFLSESTIKEGIYTHFFLSNVKWTSQNELHPDLIKKHTELFNIEEKK
jgi:hypothetical protein